MDLAAKNRKEEATKVLEKVDKMLDQSNFAYGMTSRSNLHNRNSLLFLEACFSAGDTVLAAKVSKSVKTDLQQQLKYYNSLPAGIAENMSEERRSAENYLKTMEQMESVYNPRIQIPGKLMTPAIDSTKKK